MKPLTMQWMLALVASVTASAQPPPPRGDRRLPPVPPLIAVFDTNRDRELSAAEIQAAADVLKKFDRNRDGKITLEELRGCRSRGFAAPRAGSCDGLSGRAGPPP